MRAWYYLPMNDFFIGLFIMLLPLSSLAITAYFIIYCFRHKKGDTIVFPKHLWVALLLPALGLNIFAYDTEMGFGLGVFFATIIAGIVMATPRPKRTWLHYCFAAVGIFAALCFGFRSNEFVQTINVLTTLCSILGLLLLTAAQKFEWFSGWIGLTVWQYFLRCIRQVPLLVRSLFTTKASNHPYVTVAIKTTIFTLVLLLFFAYILAKADPVFANLVSDIIDQLAGRTVLTGLLLAFLIVVLSIGLKTTAAKAPQMKWLGYTETIVPLAAIALLFTVFLYIQLRYLFGSHADFSSLGITYSDYVRKGFIELLFATFFGGVLTYIVALKRHALRSDARGSWLGALNAVVIVQLGLLLVSAVKRDMMYVEMYGLTRVRIIGGIFLVWLAVLLALSLWFALRKAAKERQVLLGGFWASACVLVALNVVNIDEHIAKATPPRNEPMDYFYIAALSFDAVDGWQTMLNNAAQQHNAIIAKGRTRITESDKVQMANIKMASTLLQDEWRRAEWRFDNYKWQNFRYADYKALKWFTSNNQEVVNKAQCLFSEIYDWQLEQGVDLYDQEYERIYTYEYPFVYIDNSYYPTQFDMLQDSWYVSSQLERYGRGVGNGVAEAC